MGFTMKGSLLTIFPAPLLPAQACSLLPSGGVNPLDKDSSHTQCPCVHSSPNRMPSYLSVAWGSCGRAKERVAANRGWCGAAKSGLWGMD